MPPSRLLDRVRTFGQLTLSELADRHGYSLVHLEYNNAFLVDADRTDVPGLTPGEAYETGYLNRPDRKKRFPWNSDVEEALTLPPEEAVDFFRRLFVPYEGSYQISIADDEGKGGGAARPANE